jgi:hypothetical protein
MLLFLVLLVVWNVRQVYMLLVVVLLVVLLVVWVDSRM